MRRVGAAAMLLVQAVLLSPVGCPAAEWSAVPRLGMAATVDSNALMTTTDQQSAAGGRLEAAGVVAIRTDTASLLLDGWLSAGRYPDLESLDANDVRVAASAETSSETAQYGASAGYTRSGTITNEFGPGGYVDVNVPSDALTGRVSGSWTLDERLLVSADADYSDVTFDGGLQYGLQDYRYWSLLAQSRYTISPRMSASLIARTGLLEPAVSEHSSDLAIGLGLQYQLSERWLAEVALGPTWAIAGEQTGRTANSYRVRVSGEWLRSSLDLGASRLLSPNSGTGALQVEDSYSMTLRHSFSERLDATAYVGFDRYTNVGRGGGDPSSYGRMGAELVWRVSQQWSVRGSYQYLHYDTDGTAVGHQALLGLDWRGTGVRLSR